MPVTHGVTGSSPVRTAAKSVFHGIRFLRFGNQGQWWYWFFFCTLSLFPILHPPAWHFAHIYEHSSYWLVFPHTPRMLQNHPRPPLGHFHDAEKRQNRAKIWPKTAPQAFCLQYAKGKAPKQHHLSIDFQWIGMAFHKILRPDAYICNLTCKRLQPRLQTFASRKSTAHRHQELPPTDHT